MDRDTGKMDKSKDMQRNKGRDMDRVKDKEEDMFEFGWIHLWSC